MKFVLCLLLFISLFTGSDGIIQQHCDTSNNLSCVVCGCGEESVFTISCEDKNDVIQIEHSYLMRVGEIESDECPLNSYTTCSNSNSTSLLNLQDRIEAIRKCSVQNSCEIKINDRIKTGKKRWVNFDFYCTPKSTIIDMSTKIENQSHFTAFYFSGANHIGQTIDCDCSVSSSGVLIFITYFIHLKPQSCSKVKFLSETFYMFGCSPNGTTLLSSVHYDIGKSMKLEIRGMEPDVEDVLFFDIVAYTSKTLDDLSINCSGCRPSTDVPGISNTTVIAILGGILAVVILINIVAIALYCFFRRRRKQQDTLGNIPNPTGNGEKSYNSYM